MPFSRGIKSGSARRGAASPALLLVVAVLIGCPGRGRPLSDEKALARLLESDELLGYAKAAAEAGQDGLSDSERAALAFLWLRDGNTARAISDLEGISPRSLGRFERKILYLVRGAAFYSEGWITLAGKEFHEADQIDLDAAEVNLEGENTLPILMASLLARAGAALSIPDRGLAAFDLAPLEGTASLVGDVTVLSYVRAEIGRRTGRGKGLREDLERLRGIARGDREASIGRVLEDLASGKEPDLLFLRSPALLIDLGAGLLGPVLPLTRAHGPAEAAMMKAEEFRGRLKRPAGDGVGKEE